MFEGNVILPLTIIHINDTNKQSLIKMGKKLYTGCFDNKINYSPTTIFKTLTFPDTIID